LSYLHGPLVTFFALVQWMVVLILLQTYAVQVLRLFPETREASTTFTVWLLDRISEFGAAAVAYLPNLLLLIVLGAVTYYVLRANSLLFNEIGSGKLQVTGFHADWARPTAGLVRVLILMLAAVVMFPYLPGARTPAFQGISIFLGALLSFGGSSAVANAVAGTILTYMRSFQLGDWVRIGDVTGEITEKSLLVTRVRTPKNEIVTIPNSTVMNGSVMNYSGQARTTGVVFHTTVTIGYDAPWRTVHELLVSAAFATNDIEPSPKPFVLQTALNDFYVSYELNAYTRNPNRMPAIYSELHQHIQDKFNEAGVEIMSPHYSQLRDGNQTTTPAHYLPTDYKAPGFRVEKGE
jgi:small-conductance mechanosensitive channel